MAVYKVIQDVEAEDKILGPLTLKQLIFAAIAGGTIFIAFRLVVSVGNVFVAIPFLPIVLVFGTLAAPLGRDQPTELWLAARIGFLTKPRKRLWDQSGIKQLVNITVPKREEKHYTDGLNQDQVRSRLHALASTLDSRGWAIKNVDLNTYNNMTYATTATDRLIDPSSLPQTVGDNYIKASDDILDLNNNETARHFEEIIQKSSQDHRQAVISQLQATAQNTNTATPPLAPLDQSERSQPKAKDDFWFMNQTTAPDNTPKDNVIVEPPVIQPGSDFSDSADESSLTEEEKAIIDKAKNQKKLDNVQYKSHHKVIPTLDQIKKDAAKNTATPKAKISDEKTKTLPLPIDSQDEDESQKDTSNKTRLKKADTIELAKANADLKISTLASLAEHKVKEDAQEVIIKLH